MDAPTLRRPMLAAPTKKADLQTLQYPLLASPKIDGVRAVNVNGRLVSRTLKAIPNRHTYGLFSNLKLHGLDGELCVGRPYDKNLMQQTTSGVMSVDGEPDVTWWVFDDWTLGKAPFHDRFGVAKHRAVTLQNVPVLPVRFVPHVLLTNYEQLVIFEEAAVNKGFEGIMLRSLDGPYKQNRSTLREGYLLKVKRWIDAEIEITGFKEQQRNENEAVKDERGYTKRSTHKEGKVDAGVLGAIIGTVVTKDDQFYGVENIEVGTGLTAEQRRNLWEGRKYLIGKIVKFKYFGIGLKDKPRFPTFVSFRDRRDM